jgi:CubicO group peptidase (beta-lactamase class C family)
LAFFAQVAWLSRTGGVMIALFFVLPVLFLIVVDVVVYFLNQFAVRWRLEPRRQELLALLASLGEQSTAELAAKSGAKSAESSRTLRRWSLIVAGLCVVAIVVFALVGGITDSSYDGAARSSGASGDWLANVITDLREEENLVGLAAMVMVDGQLEAAAAHGERKIGSGVSLEIGDRWHLGGISKSITATMIGRLVEAGQIEWTDTVGEVFPEASVHEDWNRVTLRQLLTDTAGAPTDFPMEVLRQRPALGAECTQARREAVLDVIAKPPAYPPGERNAYSNVGYTIVGAMAERVTGATWEDLMQREVFEPLELSGAGFGPPRSGDDTLEQPRGHRAVLGGTFPMDDKADNTPIMGPAATVHMTLSDLCTFATEHMRGRRGEGELLSEENYQRLHTLELQSYACGWAVREPTFEVPHRVYWHNGSNTMWYALVVFIPEKSMVIAVASNDGDVEHAEAAAWKIVEASANQFNVEPDAEARRSLPSTAFPKKSPFAAVRWQELQPEVKVGRQWYKLLAINDVPATEIVTFGREIHANNWQKRFEEDLVELLSRMGYPPGSTAKLVVQSPTSTKTQVLEDVPMTEANRQAIWNAAQARAAAEP